MSKQLLYSVIIIVGLSLVVLGDIAAQCPMCKISAESNLRDGGTAGNGLNNGILYMLAVPYLIIGTLGFVWYRNKKNYDSEEVNMTK